MINTCMPRKRQKVRNSISIKDILNKKDFLIKPGFPKSHRFLDGYCFTIPEQEVTKLEHFSLVLVDQGYLRCSERSY